MHPSFTIYLPLALRRPCMIMFIYIYNGSFTLFIYLFLSFFLSFFLLLLLLCLDSLLFFFFFLIFFFFFFFKFVVVVVFCCFLFLLLLSFVVVDAAAYFVLSFFALTLPSAFIFFDIPCKVYRSLQTIRPDITAKITYLQTNICLLACLPACLLV